jgi:hypothetical protein
MVKAFIAESHRTRPRPSRRPAAADEEVVSDVETASDEVSDAATEQPSYIDMERHSSQANDGNPAELDDLTTVDVCASAANSIDCLARSLEMETNQSGL